MSYRVLIQPPASGDLEAAFEWIARGSVERAAAWLDGAFMAIESLSALPRRCPLAPEDEAFDVEVRQLLYGGFRILLTVEDSQVRILHIRHAARRPLGPEGAE
ncbi:MAG: plasmid stabilization system protein [Chloroflexi bacterium]|nr:plasmid stabilization system protein [Chloroflexota bacterium]